MIRVKPQQRGLRAFRGGRGFRAFTLIELLVAIAITAILIVFAGQVLTHISSATTQGAAISQIIQSARVVTDQLQNDFDQMLGPGTGQNGVLVIYNYEIPDVRFTEDDPIRADINSLPAAERAHFFRRSDQIMFIRRRGSLEPLCPSDDINYSSSSSAQYVRLWYGHVLRTDDDGMGPAGTTEIPDFGKEGIPDEFAAKWMLGRQALFLDPSHSSGDNAIHNHAFGTTISQGSAAFDTPVTSAVRAPTAPDNLRQLYYGITDIAAIDYEGVGHTDYGAMVDYQQPMSERNPDQLYRVSSTGVAPNNIFPPDLYAQRAYRYMFLRERLRYNPLPKLNYDGDNDWSDSLAAWQIAQMHPMFVANVPDFEIAFAGDYDAIAGIDRDPSPDGPIKWYDLNTSPMPTAPDGFLPASSAAAATENPIYDDTAPRITGLNHAPRRRAFIFRHGPDADTAKWPYLIRIRYRIVDPNARILGQDGSPGRVFEQILSVPQ